MSLTLLLSALSACAPQSSSVQTSSQTGILGGRFVQPAEAIAQVTVKVVIGPGDYDQTCTGTLIASNFVITAAHCSQERPAPAEIVLYDGRILPIIRVFLHPKWARKNERSPEMRYDFALLEIGSNASSWAGLPAFGAQLAEGDEVKIAGYGTHLIGNEGYGDLYSLIGSVGPSYSSVEMKIMEGRGRGACNGDSGGPAYQVRSGQIILWGIDSVEGDDSGPDSPCGTSEIYSNVQSVRDWISAVAGLLTRAEHRD